MITNESNIAEVLIATMMRRRVGMSIPTSPLSSVSAISSAQTKYIPRWNFRWFDSYLRHHSASSRRHLVHHSAS